MALTTAEKGRLKKAGIRKLNTPKRTPKHPKKKAVVAVKVAGKVKIIRKGKSSAAYWANKVFWAGPTGSKKRPPKSQKRQLGIKRRK